MSTGTVDIAGLDGGLVTLPTEDLEALAARVGGPLLRPGDDGLGRRRPDLERDGGQDPGAVVLRPLRSPTWSRRCASPPSTACC